MSYSASYLAAVCAEGVGSAAAVRAIIRDIESLTRGRPDSCDPELAALWARCRLHLGQTAEALDILNQENIDQYHVVYVNDKFTSCTVYFCFVLTCLARVL